MIGCEVECVEKVVCGVGWVFFGELDEVEVVMCFGVVVVE